MPYGITQCYLLPSRGDILPLPQSIKAGTRFSNPRGMQGWVHLVGFVTYRDDIPVQRWSPIQVLTGLNVEELCCDKWHFWYTKLPTMEMFLQINSWPLMTNALRFDSIRWYECHSAIKHVPFIPTYFWNKCKKNTEGNGSTSWPGDDSRMMMGPSNQNPDKMTAACFVCATVCRVISLALPSTKQDHLICQAAVLLEVPLSRDYQRVPCLLY